MDSPSDWGIGENLVDTPIYKLHEAYQLEKADELMELGTRLYPDIFMVNKRGT